MNETRAVQTLMPHPLNDVIYGDRADAELQDSIKRKGILNPLLITSDNRIISGHRRWGAAVALKIKRVPVVVFGSTDELDIQEAIIESNRQRTKTNEQIGREYRELSRIINEISSRQGARTDIEENEDVNDVVKRPTRQAAEKIGVSHDTANKALRVVEAIDRRNEEGEREEAERLRKVLNSSVDRAYKMVRETEPLPPVEERRKVTYAEHITVEQWNQAGIEKQSGWLFQQHEKKSKFNTTNDNVEWASWTWNPITGCLHNCSYCYARDIATRFYSNLGDVSERFKPVFYPERLNNPENTPLPDISDIDDPVRRMSLRNVFTCSMADLFGKWVPSKWIELVLQQAWDNPQWNFLFLTKFPIRMAEFDYPPNTWIGTTVDSQHAVERAEKAFSKVRNSGYKGIAWLSCEPMMERLTFSAMDMFDWVVVGGASKSTQTEEFRPPFEWIVHLWNQAKSNDLPFYMKTNLFLDDSNKSIDIPNRVREYPKMP